MKFKEEGDKVISIALTDKEEDEESSETETGPAGETTSPGQEE